MSGKKITESALELFIRANGDIKGINGYISDEDGFDENNKVYGAYHAQQMTEKLLKGYLRHYNKEPEWGHDLIKYFEDALLIDKSFEELKKEIHHLNIYNAVIKYTTEIDIDDIKFTQILIDIKKIYNFPAFQNIYNEFIKNNLCNKIDETRFDKMITNYNNIMKRDED